MKKHIRNIMRFIVISLGIVIGFSQIPKTEAATNEQAMVYIDLPKQQQYKTSMAVQGWMMAKEANVQVKAYVDSTEVTSQLKRVERKDVLKSSYATQYGNAATNPTPGFQGTVDLTPFKDGKHTFMVQAVSSKTKAVLKQEKREFTIQKYTMLFCADLPKENGTVTGTNLYIQGWQMSEDKEAQIKITVNNVDYTSSVVRVQRPDVLKAYGNKYGGSSKNPTPGFKVNIDVSSWKDGTYNVKFETYLPKSKEIIYSYTRKFLIKKYKSLFCIDTPTENATFRTNITVRGWLMSEDKEAQVRLFVGKTDYTDKVTRVERADVLKAYTNQYGGSSKNPRPGYTANIDVTKWKDGTYPLKFEVYSPKTKEVLFTCTRTIKVQKYATTIYVDAPVANQNVRNTLTVRGWTMSTQKDRTIKVYLDQTDMTSKVTLVERPDVIQAVKNYGTQAENPKPGFQATIDVSQVKAQLKPHTLRIRVISNPMQEEIANIEVPVVINSVPFEEGIYGYSGLAALGNKNGTNLTYYKIGNGPNVFFGTFAMHGFEDLWGFDGQELTSIANYFKDYLLNAQDQSIASKWTIYLFQQVNPDGTNHGSTNNGPGRTTLYSWAPNNRGIDINRSWQVGSHYTRYTDSRNYNGTEGFQAYEIRFLRDFLLSHKSTSGQTVLVDLHGWLQQLIGDSTVCSYYKTQFPENSTRTVGQYGDGYLIKWARNSLGNAKHAAKAALIELPSGVSNHNQVVQRGFPTKYVNATMALLRGM